MRQRGLPRLSRPIQRYRHPQDPVLVEPEDPEPPAEHQHVWKMHRLTTEEGKFDRYAALCDTCGADFMDDFQE